MASLKEIKGRIASIKSTRKITSAMKMVASSKLHKAEATIENMLPYEKGLNHILTEFLSADLDIRSPFTAKRDVNCVALVVFSSNNSLAGAFNTNVIREFKQTLEEYRHLEKDNILIYPVGRKIFDAVKKMGYKPMADFQQMADKPSYKEAADLATSLMTMFKDKKLDKVELIYNHFRSTSTQEVTREVLLPIELKRNDENSKKALPDFIIEPSPEEMLVSLLPKVIRLKMYTVLLDSNAAEHAARTVAMQIATDNTNNLIQELTVLYNKSRQQAITNELLDIVGGSMK